MLLRQLSHFYNGRKTDEFMCRGERGGSACKTRLAGRLFTGAGGVWFDYGRISAASLLTPMAASLGVSEGMAGQAVTATALVALVTGLLITPATKSIDRRWVLMFFSVLQIISSLLVAFAPTLHVLLMGRLLLGIAIGGFWAMSTATTMRLVPADKSPLFLHV